MPRWERLSGSIVKQDGIRKQNIKYNNGVATFKGKIRENRKNGLNMYIKNQTGNSKTDSVQQFRKEKERALFEMIRSAKNM